MAANLLLLSTLVLFPALMAFSASSDLFTMTIPNRICVALALGYLALAVALGVPLAVVAIHLSCGLVVLVAAFAMFSKGWIGGGDAKLAAATALWFGFDYLLDYMIYASLFGGALTLLLLQFRKLPLPQVMARQEWIQRLHDQAGGVPYGIALAAAALAVYPETGWMSAFGL
jgi:prepilin peptidase CpaA